MGQAMNGTELDGPGFPFGNMALDICLRALAVFKKEPTISECRLQASAIHANRTLSLVDLERYTTILLLDHVGPPIHLNTQITISEGASHGLWAVAKVRSHVQHTEICAVQATSTKRNGNAMNPPRPHKALTYEI
jgi:hypothetical protein